MHYFFRLSKNFLPLHLLHALLSMMYYEIYGSIWAYSLPFTRKLKTSHFIFRGENSMNVIVLGLHASISQVVEQKKLLKGERYLKQSIN